MRGGWRFLHRWVGLLAGLLLALLGLTGAVMVWQAELDAALNPAWLAPRPACTSAVEAQPIARSLGLLAEHAPGRRAAIVVAPQRPGAAYQLWEARQTDTGWRREHFVDPQCGHYLGSRDRGALRLDAAHLIPALYALHRDLLAGEAGHTGVGIGGLLLLGLGCSGLLLAWPRSSSKMAWRRVLSIKWQAAPARRWFDLHRALGLWLAPLLLLLSFTGSALVFNQAFKSVVAAWLPTQHWPKLAAAAEAPTRKVPDLDRLVGLAEAQFERAQWTRLSLPKGAGGVAEVRLLQAGEPRADTGATRLALGPDGAVLAKLDPLKAPAGNLLLDWIFPLHSGEALGLAARCLWTLFGCVPAMLLLSGAWLWWRRRRPGERH
ncbi:MAG: PepSY domain-containing protein [Paucibacter sp.]|nr:PepSY domain-containing protein [Roseateles sp.]